MTTISNSELARMASFASEAASQYAKAHGGNPALEADARAWHAVAIEAKARERADLEVVQILEQFAHTEDLAAIFRLIGAIEPPYADPLDYAVSPESLLPDALVTCQALARELNKERGRTKT